MRDLVRGFQAVAIIWTAALGAAFIILVIVTLLDFVRGL